MWTVHFIHHTMIGREVIFGCRMQISPLCVHMFIFTIIPRSPRFKSLLRFRPYPDNFPIKHLKVSFLRRMQIWIFLQPLHVFIINENVPIWIDICPSNVIPAHVHILDECIRVLRLLPLIVLNLSPLSHSLEPFKLLVSDISLCQSQCIHVSVLVKVDLGPLESLLCEHEFPFFVQILQMTYRFEVLFSQQLIFFVNFHLSLDLFELDFVTT